jgi:hypothetical protein
VARSLKMGMMTETLGAALEDVQRSFQCGFAVHQKRKNSSTGDCDELVTILSLALSSQSPIPMSLARSPLIRAAQTNQNKPNHDQT